jgi:hypothetical protein
MVHISPISMMDLPHPTGAGLDSLSGGEFYLARGDETPDDETSVGQEPAIHGTTTQPEAGSLDPSYAVGPGHFKTFILGQTADIGPHISQQDPNPLQ